MANLIELLLNTPKSKDNHLIERLDLIEGYNEAEIQEIEKRYNLSIHGQFKEFLMTMGKCSGGLLLGDEIKIYSRYAKPDSKSFGVLSQQDWQDDYLYLDWFKNTDLVTRKFFHFAHLSDAVDSYFVLTADNNDMVYKIDGSQDTEIVKEFGTLNEFLVFYRSQIEASMTGNEYPSLFADVTTGRLL